MDAVVESLLIDLLEWLAGGERPYEDVMSAWRTSCPKLPIWEEATDRALVALEKRNGKIVVVVTEQGLAHLRGPLYL